MNQPLRLSLRREGDKIYFLVNLVRYGCWTVEDFAAMRDFGEKFWKCDFTDLILPRLRPLEPECAACGGRESLREDSRVHGELLCAACRAKLERGDKL